MLLTGWAGRTGIVHRQQPGGGKGLSPDRTQQPVDRAGLWENHSAGVTVGSPAGVESSPSLDAVVVTDGVLDTGSGASFGDTLLLAHPGA